MIENASLSDALAVNATLTIVFYYIHIVCFLLWYIGFSICLL